MALLDVTAFGASPASADNTTPIQSALDAAQQGDTVVVPAAGTFLTDAVRMLKPKSGTNLQIDGILKAIPNAVDVSAIVFLSGVTGVNVSGVGAVQGERAVSDNGNPALSHGFGLAMQNSSQIQVKGLRGAYCKGDAFYIEGCTDVIVDGVTALGCKRNGLSLIWGQRIKILNSTFAFSQGPSPLPQAGIDVEPDHPDQPLLDITITGNNFVKNRGAGCYLAFDPSAVHGRISVVNNNFDQHYRDGFGPPIGGKNPALANLCYALFRWMPGYDYWYYPTEFQC